MTGIVVEIGYAPPNHLDLRIRILATQLVGIAVIDLSEQKDLKVKASGYRYHPHSDPGLV